MSLERRELEGRFLSTIKDQVCLPDDLRQALTSVKSLSQLGEVIKGSPELKEKVANVREQILEVLLSMISANMDVDQNLLIDTNRLIRCMEEGQRKKAM